MTVFFINPFLFEAGADFESIATVTVGSGGASEIEFTSIPGTYQHLQIRYVAKTNRSGNNQDNVVVRLNADSASNYSWHWLYGDGGSAAAAAGSSTNNANVTFVNSTNTTTSAFGVGVIDILDYASTSKTKTIRAFSGYDINGSGFVAVCSGNWRNTGDAVTTIKLIPGNGSSIVQHSTAALYGIKAP